MIRIYDRFKKLVKDIKKYERDFIESCDLNIPKTVYKVDRFGKLIAMEVTKMDYYNEIKWSGLPITKKSEIIMQEYIASEPKLLKENILIITRWKEDNIFHTSCFMFSDAWIGNEINKIIFNEDTAQRISSIRKQAILKEDMLLNNGHKKCNYCGNIKPVSAMENTIIVRNRQQTEQSFCDTGCASHAQMAAES